MKFPLEAVRLERQLNKTMDKHIINSDCSVDLSTLNSEASFEIASGEHYLYLFNIKEDNRLDIEVKDNAILHLSIYCVNLIKAGKIQANLGKNSKIIAYFADFTTDTNKLDVNINLNDENATCEWHLASLSSNKDNKEISVSIYHNHPQTFGRIDNYGVCKDSGHLVFSGTSHILKGCHQSKSHQNAKIVVFDEGCVAKAKPVLKIDENDIEASHAATVGKVSDEHIFYLTSRGLTNEEAKMLITLGYLKPILKGFNTEIQTEIDQLIERRLVNV